MHEEANKNPEPPVMQASVGSGLASRIIKLGIRGTYGRSLICPQIVCGEASAESRRNMLQMSLTLVLRKWLIGG